MRSVAAFIRRKWKGCRTWSRQSLTDWIEWFQRDERCLVLRVRDEVVGVALVRRLTDRQRPSGHYEHEPDGRVLWVDLAVADRESFPLLLSVLRQHETDVDIVGYERSVRDAAVRWVSPERMMNIYGRRRRTS